MKKRGFTLIELLVVIAIIGILAAIVMVSLSGARDRAKDTRIISDMGQLRTLGEVYYGNHQNYSGLADDPDENTLAGDIATQGGEYNIYINSNGAGFCAVAKLNSGEYWCVDSKLKSEQDADGLLTSCVSGCESSDCHCD